MPCLFGRYVAGCNWTAIYVSIRNKRRGIAKGYSVAPAIGPVFGYLGLEALPIHKSAWVWLVLLLDPSTFVVVGSLPFFYRQVVNAQVHEQVRERRPRLGEQLRELTRQWRR